MAERSLADVVAEINEVKTRKKITEKELKQLDSAKPDGTDPAFMSPKEALLRNELNQLNEQLTILMHDRRQREASLPNAPTGCKPTWLHTWLPFATLWQAEGDQPQPQHAGSAAAAVMPATGPRQNFMAWTTARPAIASSPTPSQHLTSCRQRRLHHAVPLQAPPERTQY